LEIAMARMQSTLAAAAIALGATSGSVAADFSAAVEQVLMRQKEITDLDADKQREMISCVNDVLADVPDSAKAAVADAGSVDAMEDAFGEMVMAEQAKLKQEITAACGQIVMEAKG
jgi:hypothetical protein